ncbi:uncharacterized protein LOC110441707 [Mizuhopecten yessoensis]|uniref:Uncharacterized protein n=1 Tax=Mizuhopecten yessoensis TaxID=6573 RepID=A0A210PIW0_MIZYE|nr:uncharacterized protein LOC110441707 [Mizuhopecten yessoensis]XP_021340603.1 uncharacterized protein LOC110441707 [Mizuhopecten yessoensis]OWF36422.1 hypothetical protein KP79_PYT03202 [Mizuhopecten yessoensis]
MVKKKDLLKIFFIYICLCHPSPAHPCGNNPLRNLMFISDRTGRSIDSVLVLLRDFDIYAYEHFQYLFNNYAACIGMVDTGYFKRTSSSAHHPSQSHDDPHSQLTDMPLHDIVNFINSLSNESTKSKDKKSSRQNLLRQVLTQARHLIHDGQEFNQQEVFGNTATG